MRSAVHEPAPASPAVLSPAADSGAGPERRCILTGARAPRAALIRLVEAPDGQVVPDLAARLPGRGAWVAADGAMLAEAVRRGTLARALARAWRRPPPPVPADLAACIGDGLERRFLARLGLEHRAGRLLFGAEKLEAAARAGRLVALLHAGDAAADGVAKLEQALRSGGRANPSSHRLPIERERLSRALGRDNMVHVGITDGRAAARVLADLARLRAYGRLPHARTSAPPEPGACADPGEGAESGIARGAAQANEGSE